MNVADILSAKKAGIELSQDEMERPSKIKRFTQRRYNVIGHRTDGTMMTKDNVAIITAKDYRDRCRKEGCYRVDLIEVQTTVNEPIGRQIKSRKMQFGEQTFDPADEKIIPDTLDPLPIGWNQHQASHEWGHIRDLPDTVLSNRPIVKDADRRAIKKAAIKRNALANAENTRYNDWVAKEYGKVMAYDKVNGNLIFSGTTGEAVIFLQRTNRAVSDCLFYTDSYTMEGSDNE